jgi:branched-chain amino acid transport system substrate-binding protein
MKRHSVLATLFTLCIGVLWLSGTLMAQQVTEVPIGVIYPLSGPVAEIGNTCLKGVTLAIEQKNAEGGIKSLGGAKIKMYVSDTQGKPEIGVVETEKLINEKKVVAILGAYQSSVTLPTTQVAERLKTPYMNGNAVADPITERGFKYTFRTISKAVWMAESQFEFIRDVAKKTGKPVKTAAILYEDTLWGQSQAKGWRALASKYNIQIVADLPYSAKATDYTAVVSKAKAAAPDVALMASYITDAMLMQRTFKQLDFNCLAIIGSGGGHTEPAFIAGVGKDADYIFTQASWSEKMKGAGAKHMNVFNAFKKRWNEGMNQQAASAYHSAWVVIHALEKAGSLDREKLRNTLAGIQLDSTKDEGIILPGKVAFDQNGQVDDRLIMLQVLSSDFYPVYPFAIASRDAVFPIPAWSERK